MKFRKGFFTTRRGSRASAEATASDGSRGKRAAWFPRVLAVWLTGCGAFSGVQDGQAADGAKTLSIASWNVQALFDGREDGTEYSEYLGPAGWSEEKYQARLSALSDAVGSMAQGAPDILALQELENGEVLRELAGGALAKYGYQWSYFAANPGAVLGTGLLSRLPLSELKVHSVTIAGETSPRPLLEARALAGDLPLVLFVCHWKSKTGGGETESRRRASAKALARRLLETREAEPDLPVIIMGDLNENHDEFYRLAQAALSALLPDDPAAWAVAEATASDGSGASAVAWELSGFAEPGKTGASGSGSIKAADFLVISGKKPPQPEYFPSDTAVLYSPWGQELEKGSYYYQGGWETIDHFLLSEALFDGLGWEFDDCEAPREEPFADSRGIPRAYNPRTGNGLSDHLPLLLRLKMRD